ncbi:Zn-finger in Ran binding protein and others family protein [Leishmania donovani]|uniref:Zn-finger in Ran binding protein and others family protein n=1 Tax=Leishmania donovani TaxID=5661 RepID=A0A504WZZ6_LEIDO|nr:Zn-finger in Ran binding protein and others family protein [Leishmania donovani]
MPCCGTGSARADSARPYTTLTRSLRQSWKSRSLRPWMCAKESCRAVNQGIRKECESCGTEKPQLLGWKCVGCSTINYAGVRKCKKCADAIDKSKEFWIVAEEEILRRATEKTLMLQQQQEHFDSVSYTEADEQFMNPLEGAEALDPTLRAIHPGSEAPITGRVLKLSAVAPFVAGGVPETRHSPLHQRRKVHPALQTVLEGATAPEGPPGFDWMCRNSSCGHINPGDEESCLRCGTHITPSEWECPLCASLNHLARSRCFYCKNRIPVCWTCSACQGTTSIYDKACRGCGMDRPAAEPRTVRELERGVPDQGVADPFSAAGWGGTDSPGAAAVAAPVQHNNWMCAYCQASNFRTRHDCWKCGRTSERAEEWSSQALSPQYEREGFQEGANTKSAEGAMNASWKSAGDWLCAKCYSKNFRNRLECYRCGARKHALPATRSSSVRKPVKL